jgi:glycosyltransferase involved in cell wall biosynthesis
VLEGGGNKTDKIIAMSHSDEGHTRRKSVLMVTYHFPPMSAAGTQRNVGFARWLPTFGWRPVVLTASESSNHFEHHGEPVPEDVEVVRSYQWGLNRLLSAATGALNRLSDALRVPRRPSPFYRWCLPDPQIAWCTTARGIALTRRCDCVYVSCSPFSAALSGALIKRATGKPLVLDFRDAWAINPHSGYGGPQRRVIDLLERWVVNSCDALILNTPGAENAYRRRYPQHAQKMICIPNGFDRLNEAGQRKESDTFTIMHLGDFYRTRTPDRLLEALANLRRDDIEFVHVGPAFSSYARFKDRVRIRIISHVPHTEALELMRSPSVLFLSQGWEEGVKDYIAVASKTYEYLATGLPIVADCPPGDNADIVRKYASRAWVVTSADVCDVQRAVLDAYNSRDTYTPQVSREFVETFSRERLAERLSMVLDRAVSGVPHFPRQNLAGVQLSGSEASAHQGSTSSPNSETRR